jgi:hypothetical protein
MIRAARAAMFIKIAAQTLCPPITNAAAIGFSGE